MDPFMCAAMPAWCTEGTSRTRERPAIVREHKADRPAPSAKAGRPSAQARYLWDPPAQATTPAQIPTEISLPGKIIVAYIALQWQCAYEDGRVAVRHGQELCSPISSGKKGKRTETPLTEPEGGPQKIVWKHKDHCSREFPRPNDGCSDGGAPMPYAAFFDTSGHAFHAGSVRTPIGVPWGESHGCVRLPSDMARILFEDFLEVGTGVIITWDAYTFDLLWQQNAHVAAE